VQAVAHDDAGQEQHSDGDHHKRALVTSLSRSNPAATTISLLAGKAELFGEGLLLGLDWHACSSKLVAVEASAPEIWKFPRAWTFPAEPAYLSIGIHNAIVLLIASLKRADTTVSSELLEDGRVVPVIDRRCDLDGVPEALQNIEHGHARAKVAVRIS
jgi:zinc-binding alcohol dehydrogenase family protein